MTHIQIFFQFLGVFGDAKSIKKAADRHAKLFLPHRSKSELKKRHAEDYLASDKAKVAKSYPDAPSSAQSLMGAYASAQNQWTAGYGLQPQSWPPVTQAPWTPGYSQQQVGSDIIFNALLTLLLQSWEREKRERRNREKSFYLQAILQSAL